jgi:hypothetical protein
VVLQRGNVKFVLSREAGLKPTVFRSNKPRRFHWRETGGDARSLGCIGGVRAAVDHPIKVVVAEIPRSPGTIGRSQRAQTTPPAPRRFVRCGPGPFPSFSLKSALGRRPLSRSRCSQLLQQRSGQVADAKRDWPRILLRTLCRTLEAIAKRAAVRFMVERSTSAPLFPATSA